MKDGGNMCRLQLRDSNKVAKNIRKHLDLLVFAPEKSPATEYNRRSYQVLLARRIDQLKAHGFFHVPRKILGNVILKSLLSDLKGKQCDVVELLSNAPGGTTITK